MGCSPSANVTTTVPQYTPPAGCTPQLMYCPCNNDAGNALNSWVSVAEYFSPCGFTFTDFQHETSDGYNNSYITVTNPKNGRSHLVYGWDCSNGHMYKDQGTLQYILNALLS